MKNVCKTVIIELLGSLCDFIGGEEKHSRTLELSFELNPSLKDLLESRGIPHTAVFEVWVDGHKQSLNYNVRDGDHIKVREWCDEFRNSTRCGKVFWKGSHYEKLKKEVDQFLS